jgi:hypothetical protein
MKIMASRMRRSATYVVMLLTLTAFPTPGAPQIGPSQAPVGWDSDVKLAEAQDRNADAKIVEIDLRAELADVQIAPGKVVHAWTFDERPGTWMFHCHILDHADGGLMGTVRVGDVVTTEHAHHVKQ